MVFPTVWSFTNSKWKIGGIAGKSTIKKSQNQRLQPPHHRPHLQQHHPQWISTKANILQPNNAAPHYQVLRALITSLTEALD
jgi:hypothetical protein